MDINISQLEVKIKDLRLAGKYEEALELCNLSNINIKYQRVKTLIALGQYYHDEKYFKEALQICNSYNNDKRFSKRIPEIQTAMTNRNPVLVEILSRIYFDNITIDEIEKASINEWDKEIFIIAYYDRKKDKKALEIIKKLKVKYNNDSDKKKILNILYNKLIDKKHLFDLTNYEKVIGCFIDFELDKYIKEDNKEEITEAKTNIEVNKYSNIPNIENKTQEKSKSTSKIVSCVGVRNNSRYSNQNKSNNTEVMSNTVNQGNLLIKDLFPVETLAILKNIYSIMSYIEYRMMAIDAWDKFEVLINKSADDKDALKRMINLLERIQNRNQTVNPNYDHEKYQKLLSKN